MRSFVVVTMVGCAATLPEPERPRPPLSVAPVPRTVRCGVSEVLLADGREEVRGHVIDASGAPVACAAVELTMGMLVWTARTDGDGAYRFSGFAWHEADLPYPRLAATTLDGRASLPVALMRQQHSYRLVVQPTGAVEGTVTGVHAHDGLLLRADTGEGLIAVVDPKGAFYRGLVPVGHYRAGVIDGGAPPIDVDIVAGHTASLTFELPPPTVNVRLHVGHICTTAVLRDGQGTTVATASCSGTSSALLKSVAPGAYEVCVDTTCRRVDIDDNRDSFEFP